MKAPDKIYVAISKFMCPGLASCSKLKDDMTEYIRKDAVLELLQKRNKEIRGAAHCAFRSYELQEVYWRINEL